MDSRNTLNEYNLEDELKKKCFLRKKDDLILKNDIENTKNTENEETRILMFDLEDEKSKNVTLSDEIFNLKEQYFNLTENMKTLERELLEEKSKINLEIGDLKAKNKELDKKEKTNSLKIEEYSILIESLLVKNEDLDLEIKEINQSCSEELENSLKNNEKLVKVLDIKEKDTSLNVLVDMLISHTQNTKMG